MRRSALLITALGFTLACGTESQTVTSLELSQTTASVAVGATLILTATPVDQDGVAITGKTITWSTGNQGIATVTSDGVITGVAAGTVTITATCDGVSADATVTVTAASGTPGSGS